ncbi:MAK10-like protein [Tanacetum coccineum]
MLREHKFSSLIRLLTGLWLLVQELEPLRGLSLIYNNNGKRRATSGPTLVCEHCGFNGETIDLFEDDLGYPQGSIGSTREDERVATFENDSAMSKGGVEDMPDTEPIQNIENQPLRRSERSSVFLNKYNEYVVDSRVKFSTKRSNEYREMDVLYGNDTWDITELPSDRKAIGSKWVYKIKFKLNGETGRYKATLVAKWFNQKEFMHKPLKSHLKIAFKVLRYFKGSPCKGIHITKSADTSLKVYVDVDWAKCVLEFFVIAKLQAAIKIAANPAFHERTKHLEFNLRFVRDKIISGVIETKKISSADQRVYVLTKGSVSTWEDLTTRFFAQLFPLGRTSKLWNDILMFQQHQVQIFYDHVNPATRRTIDQVHGGTLRGKNAEESWALLEDLALYDNENWNDPRDFAKLVKKISLPQDFPSTSDRRLIKLENQVQRLMEAHLSPKSLVKVNKITSSYKARSKWFTFKPEQNNLGDTYNPSWRSHPNLKWRQPQNSQNNFSNPPNRFQPGGSSRPFNNNPQNFNNHLNLKGLVSNFMASHDARLSKFEADFKQQQSEITNKIDTFLKAINDRMTRALPSDMIKNPKLNVNSTSSVLSARSYPLEDP